MPRISMKSRLEDLDHQKSLHIRLRRLFRKELRYLRNLPTPEISITEYWNTNFNLTYHATFSDMRASEKYLARFGAVCGLENLTSEDEPSGIRVFRGSYTSPHADANGRPITLYLRLLASPLTDDAPEAKCRKVLIGHDTNTYTSTTPKYKIVCDD